MHEKTNETNNVTGNAIKIKYGGNCAIEQNNGPDIGIFLFFLFIVASILALLLKKLQEVFFILQRYLNQLILIFYRYKIYIFLSLIVAVLILYSLYRAIAKKMQTRRKFKAKLSDESRYVNEFLKTNLDVLSKQELKSKISEVKNKHFFKEYPELNLKFSEAKNLLIELEHEEKLDRLKDRKFFIEDEIKELKLEKEKLQRVEAEEEMKIKNKLCLYENYVFEKSKLNEDEIEVLLKEKYQQVNQYCVQQQRVITAFVKPPLNHSVTHSFLVWSVSKLLEEFEGVEDIEEHETRGADITFEFNGKMFAIEVETGNLLGKTEQRENKIKFLNEAYENRWLIIVSHRSLVKKYKKFGNCTQRNGVREKLGKMLKN